MGVGALLLVLVDAAPGDAIDLLPDSDTLREELTTRWRLDAPLPARLAGWLADAIRGDLGTSWVVRPGAPVTEVVARPVLRSLCLLAGALVLSLSAALPLAWAESPGRRWARTPARWVSLVPLFLLAHGLIAGLNAGAWRALEAGWIDRPAWFALPQEDSALRTAIAVALLAWGSGALSSLVDDLRDALATLRASPFVEAARARGESTRAMVARNLAPTLAALLADRLAFFLGGLVILEKVLLLDGAGALLWRAALDRDLELVLALGLGAGMVVATGRLAADLLRAALDPRLSTASGAG